MRNLKLQYCKEKKTGIQNPKQLLLQPDIDRKDNEISYIITENKVFTVDETNEPKIIAELPAEIVSAEFLQLENAICVATAAGEVLLINPDTLATSEGTFCDVGIECMAWSPNQEVVVFITKAKNVVVMTCTYDVLGEQPLDAQLASEQQFVNVGWGKKETQFHGNAGKQAAKQSAEFQPPTDVQQLPQDVHIAWRGDGAYFAVSYVASQVGRTFSVYDSEGKLQHTAEKWNGMQTPLAWRPSGNWIAQPQVFANKSTVALFEKNGLRHREVVLPFDLNVEPIVQLRWSNDSDILALHTATADAQRIYLYTINNYHWYLKQVLVYKELENPLAFFHWDSRLGAEHVLHVLLESGQRYTHRWHFAIDCQPGTAIVYVIDGQRLLLTDYNKAVVPPPMCWRTIALSAGQYINAVGCCKSHIAIYTSERAIHLYNSDKHSIYNSAKPHVELSQIQLANFCCDKLGNLYATHTLANHTRLMLFSTFVVGEDYHIECSLRITGTINALTEGPVSSNFIYVQTLSNRQVYEIALERNPNQLKLKRTYLQLQQSADQMQFYSCGKTSEGLITLRSQHLLQIDEQRMAEDVTSFCVVGNYLAYTQLNALHFVRLLDRRVVDTRTIERGAKLVTGGAGDARLVLQLPRGNLEMICPRVLVLQHIGDRLRPHYFEAAMRIVRKQRINLNIICDHDVQQFVEFIDWFIEEIHDSQWLCLFLSELQNEDYALGMYASNYDAAKQHFPLNYSADRKVEFICQLMLGRMEKAEEPKLIARYRLPIITAYVKLGKLEQALQLIWQHKQKDSTLADQLLKYLLYLVDVNDLYNVALGTYDFGLVLFVAQKSQKDPKEFLPYLNELKSLPLDYRKFKIDEHLKRYERALTHLAACGEEHYDLALEFIDQHKLYSRALIIYQSQSVFHKRICVAFADHLRANAQLEAASLMYERGDQLQQALLSARHTLDWQRVLLLAQRDGTVPLEEIAHSLVAPLQQQDRHLEAYELIKRFSQPASEEPLDVLIRGHLFGRAIYEAGLLTAAGAADLLTERVKPALIAYVAQLEGSLCADRKLFGEHKQRLLEIRKRQAASADGGNDEHDVDIDEVDLLSDTSSMQSSRHSGSSRGTGKTFRSSKNRRKHERKLLSLKPGNPFEDIALIDALHNQITKIGQLQQQQLVRDTCKALLQLHTEDAQAAMLQRQYDSILSEVQSSLDEIWIPELMGGSAQHLTGPNVDYLALRKEQRYALINPLKRFKPQLNIIDWKHGILH
ncbi:putative elongator complex protein 1 [Drosophila grimshawi]|uniref:Elongator complex protein 1 n=1 Tax=Drosophila grimshawi TaxID=7222 RepID=B4JFH7_DROGR|nr:putative elongator complex protein 1 [Drosophila grimshawi]EDV93458.1 GH18263 [Drosophila grimshawi]